MVTYKISLIDKNNIRPIELDAKNLQTIDEFTMKFSNEQYLKKTLLDLKLISLEEYKNKLYITYKNKNEIKKLPIVYSEQKKYFDEMLLLQTVKSLSSDIVFLQKLADHYSIGSAKYNFQGLNVAAIRNYVNTIRFKSKKIYYSEDLNVALEDLVLKAILTIDKKTGECKLNYRGLRDLNCFVHKYIITKDKKQNEENLDYEQIDLFDINNKKQDEENLDYEQINLFDINNKKQNEEKWHLSSEGDPDFPPNSEEEAMYNRYLENLEEIAIEEERKNRYR